MNRQIETAMALVSRHTGVAIEDITGNRKKRTYTDARIMICGLMAGSVKDDQLAEAINRHRTTALYFRHQSNDRERFDPAYRREFAEVKEKFKGINTIETLTKMEDVA